MNEKIGNFSKEIEEQIWNWRVKNTISEIKVLRNGINNILEKTEDRMNEL